MLKRAPVLAVTLLLFAVVPAAARDGYRRLAALDARHYRVRLEIKEADDEIVAETEITSAVNSEAGGELPLDFGALTVDAVTVDGTAAVVYKTGGGKLDVALPRAYRRGETLRVAVRYHGRPPDGLFFKRNKTGGRARRETVVGEREQSFDFKLDASPAGVAHDPDEWLLKVLALTEE